MAKRTTEKVKPNKIGQTILNSGLEGLNRFYGIYRGMVMENNDPMGYNRLYVWVPEVMGGITRWALPRGQHGGNQYGYKNLAPLKGEVVYISFEYGDASKPLWEPHGWGEGESSKMLADPAVGGVVTPNGNMILYNERTNTLHINFEGRIFIHSNSDLVLSGGETVTVKSEDGVVINEGKNGGLVNSKDLTEKLNQLVRELEQVKLQINTHTHNCTAPGSPSGPPLTPITQMYTLFNSLDYEDDKALH